jgi:hypothetical protein
VRIEKSCDKGRGGGFVSRARDIKRNGQILGCDEPLYARIKLFWRGRCSVTFDMKS